MNTWIDPATGLRYVEAVKPLGAVRLLDVPPPVLPATVNADFRPGPSVIRLSPDLTPVLAVANAEHYVDTSVQAMHLTLPLNPNDGDFVLVKDYGDLAGTNNIYVHTSEGLETIETLGVMSTVTVLSTNGASVRWVYRAALNTWLLR